MCKMAWRLAEFNSIFVYTVGYGGAVRRGSLRGENKRLCVLCVGTKQVYGRG